jgi:hypothetical protein
MHGKTMRTWISLVALAVLAISLQTQTNSSRLYLHFGIGYGGSAQRLLSSEILLDQPIFVAGSDHWQIKGRLKQSTNGITADLMGSTGPQSGYYKGPIPLEKPVFSQGGASSGGATVMWFGLSTNSDCRPLVERIKVMGKQMR